MRRFILFLPLVLLLSVLLRWGAGKAVEPLETHLFGQARAIAAVQGADWARFGVDGLRLAVAGDAPDESARAVLIGTLDRALPLVAVRDRTALDARADRMPPLRVDLMRSADGITLTGRFPSAADRAELIGALGRALPGVALQDLSGLDAGTPSAAVGAEYAVAVAVAERLPRAFVRIEPARLRVEAVLASEGQRARVEAALTALAGPALALDLALEVPRRPLVPFRLVLQRRPGAPPRLTRCAARSAVEAEAIAAALRAAGQPAPMRCSVGTGGPAFDWAAAAEAGIQALAALPAGAFELSGSVARLTAASPTTEQAFETALATLALRLPAAAILDAELAAPPPAAAGGARRWLDVQRDDRGMVLAGRLEGAVETAALADVAAAGLGRDRVDVANLLALAPGVAPAERPVRFQEAALAVLSALMAPGIEGRAALGAERLRLRLVARDGAQAVAVYRRLAAALPPGLRLDSQIVVDLPGAVAAVPLPPAACAAALNRVVARRPISFDPGSTRIDDAGQAVVGALGAVLLRCEAAEMEIGGHTDNQGRASMNLRLSRARAEAVRDALGAALPDGGPVRFYARGYGEEAPIASNATEAGRARNRRIAFRADTAASGGVTQ
ncbi:MAG: OmpA family protein [Pseudomonadota bacterium]